MLDHVLYDFVRTQHGAAYGDSVGRAGLAARVDASAAGKSEIGGSGDAGRTPAAYVPIADALRFYRDRYITGFYAGQETNRSVAAQIAASAINRGDFRDYLLATDRLRAVTADAVTDAVTDAVNRYLVGAPTLWVAVGPPGLLSTIDRREYGAAEPGD